MTDALRAIVERTREQVERSKAAMPFAEMEALVAQAEPPRNFFAAVTQRQSPLHVSVIAGIGRLDAGGRPVRPEFSPPTPPTSTPTAPPDVPPASKGAPSGSYDVAGIARRYHAAGAAAIAVSTDPATGGRLADLESAREAVPVPILRKDPIIDPWQLWESRAAGADAVLLIAETLTEGTMVDLLILAQQLRLTAVLEVRSMDSLLRVRPHVGFPHRAYSLLSINNRDLAPDPDGDLSVTLRMLDMVDDLRVVASEGGVRNRADVMRLKGAGVRIVIVGNEILRQSDPAAALGELCRPGVR